MRQSWEGARYGAHESKPKRPLRAPFLLSPPRHRHTTPPWRWARRIPVLRETPKAPALQAIEGTSQGSNQISTPMTVGPAVYETVTGGLLKYLMKWAIPLPFLLIIQLGF